MLIPINKEDYEKERLRWQQKLDETERRLAEAEIFNSEMNQIKAELNKKIVEMERNQKPLIEQNRRLNERAKLLQNEIKKSEQKLSHSQDDFLTLKDAHEKLLKENTILKERRAFPEKMEELDRYRTQVLEYSKCITALRQAGLEKDRRYELLLQKIKKLKKLYSLRKNGENEDDRQSSYGGSDCSAASTLSLDTITEDLREINNIGYAERLKDQLLCARATIAQQQRIIQQNNNQPENGIDFFATITHLQNQILELQSKNDKIERERDDLKDMSELLEFQLLENNETMKHELEEIMTKKEMIEKCIETDKWIHEDDCELLSETPLKLAFSEVCNLKKEIANLKRSSCLNDSQRLSIHKLQSHLEFMENQQLQLELNFSAQIDDYLAKEDENELIIHDLEEKIKNFQLKENENKIAMLGTLRFNHRTNRNCTKVLRCLSNAQSMRSRSVQCRSLSPTLHYWREKELQTEIDDLSLKNSELRKENNKLNGKLNALTKEVDNLRTLLAEKDKIVSNYEKKLNELECNLKVVVEQKFKDNEELSMKINDYNELLKNKQELQVEVSRLSSKKSELEMQRQKLMDEVKILSNDNANLHYLIKEKDQMISANEMKLSELESNLKISSEYNLKDREEMRKSIAELNETVMNMQNESAKLSSDLEIAEKEKLKLKLELDSAVNTVKQLRDEIRPAIKSDLERRFEESRYRLKCALANIHEYEEEISMLKSQECGLKARIKELEDIELQYQRDREYTTQLESQFASQVQIIDVLKQKAIQHKKLMDFIVILSNTGKDSNFTRFRDEIDKFILTEKDETIKEFCEVMRQLTL